MKISTPVYFKVQKDITRIIIKHFLQEFFLELKMVALNPNFVFISVSMATKVFLFFALYYNTVAISVKLVNITNTFFNCKMVGILSRSCYFIFLKQKTLLT